MFTRQDSKGLRVLVVVAMLAFVLSIQCVSPKIASAQKTELTVAYMPHPIQDQQVKWMEEWAERRGDVTIKRSAISYEIYVAKLSSNFLLTESDYDVFWHNDDWGQLWAIYLEPLDGLEALHKFRRELVDGIFTYEGHDTAIPFIEQHAGIFYRTDLIPKPPETWEEFVNLSIALQNAGKVKWGFVGGMAYPHSWGSTFWAMWANNSDVFFPPLERNNEVLAANGWRPIVTDPSFIQMVEFWWDNIHTYKICPPGMVGYTRVDSDAIFMAGDAAMTWNDREVFGEYDDPEKSKVAGKVWYALYPAGPNVPNLGPHDKGASMDMAPWAWAVPKTAPKEKKKLAKELLNWLICSEEVQVDLWKTTGGLPPNLEVQAKLAKTDPFFGKFAKVLEGARYSVAPAYYFPKWSEVHSVFADYMAKAIIGPRDKIETTMQELYTELREIMKEE